MGEVTSRWRRIVVVQTWGIGDLIMTTPMLRALRDRLPDAEISLIVGSERGGDVVGDALCDRVFALGSGRRKITRLGSLLLRLRAQQVDAAFLAVGMNPRLAQALRLVSGVNVVAGCTAPPRRWGFTHWVPHDLERHRVLLNLDVARAVLPDLPEAPPTCFHVPAEAQQQAEQAWENWGLKGFPVMTLHPGSHPKDGLDKRLPVEKCAGVIHQLLARNSDLRILIFIGPDEMDLLPRFREIRHPRVVLATGLKLPVIAGLIGKSQVLLAGDSGLGHIGAAMGVPVVTLFGPTYPQHIRPWGLNNVVLRAATSPPCMPCYNTPLYGKCPHGQKCLTAIEDSAVLRTICHILGCESAPPRDRLASPLHS